MALRGCRRGCARQYDPDVGFVGSDGGPSDSDFGIAIGGAVVGGIAALAGMIVKPGDDDYHALANAFSTLNPRKPVAYEPPAQVFVHGPYPYAIPR